MKVTNVEQYMKGMDRHRDWLHSHPNRVEPEMRAAGLNWIEVELHELAQEMKNDRPGRRPYRLRTRLKELVAAIVTYSAAVVKEEPLK